MSKHKRRQPKGRGVKNSRLFQIFIIAILAIGIIGGGIFAFSSFNANAQPNRSEIASGQSLNGTDLAIPISDSSSPSCVKYIIPPEEPRLETALSIDLTQEDGVPAFLEFLIIPADEVMFLDDGNIKPAQELQVGDKIHMQSGKVGLIQSVETELYTPEPIAVNEKGQSLRRVLAKSKRWTETILNLHTPTEIIETTPEHPFYVNGEWIEAKDLRQDDQINSRTGNTIRVLKTEEVHAPQYVYNLLVEGAHNFYVGQEGLLAHNCTDIPLGFPDRGAYERFGQRTRAGLQDVGYADVDIAFQGSSVTGKSFRTGEPFDVGRVSDFDIALGSPELLEAAKDAGVSLRSRRTRTGPIKPDTEYAKALGINDLLNQLSEQAGREVSFMIYRDVNDAIKRTGSGIIVPR